ncbi:MAG: BolA/IbaG family iron-sulfur metabolism protein [Halococcoides sp.]
MDRSTLAAHIEADFEDADVTVTAPRPNDTDHLAARVVSPAFEGMATLDRHDRVREAVGDLLTTEIHALKITARTPAEVDE